MPPLTSAELIFQVKDANVIHRTFKVAALALQTKDAQDTARSPRGRMLSAGTAMNMALHFYLLKYNRENSVPEHVRTSALTAVFEMVVYQRLGSAMT